MEETTGSPAHNCKCYVRKINWVFVINGAFACPWTDLRFFSAEQSRCVQPFKRKEGLKKKKVTKLYLRNPFKCSHCK